MNCQEYTVSVTKHSEKFPPTPAKSARTRLFASPALEPMSQCEQQVHYYSLIDPVELDLGFETRSYNGALPR